MLTAGEKQILIGIARSTLEIYLREHRIPSFDKNSYPEALLSRSGAFVTLYRKGELRGCIGRIRSDEHLYKLIRDITISSATKDHRFKAVSADELKHIQLEISVLTEPVRIKDPSEIQLGRHGIIIKKGMNSGTFLPDVASNYGWDLEQFLGRCARDKAHIGWDGWRDAEIFTYETETFTETEAS